MKGGGGEGAKKGERRRGGKRGWLEGCCDVKGFVGTGISRVGTGIARARHLLVNEHVLMQVGDVHVRLPDELELIVAELDKAAGRHGHGGQLVQGCGPGDLMRGLVLVLDFVSDLAVGIRVNAQDSCGVTGRRGGGMGQPRCVCADQVQAVWPVTGCPHS